MTDVARTAQPAAAATPPAWQNGAAMATLAAIASVQPSLQPRSRQGQAAVTGISVLAGFATGVAVDSAARALDDATSLDARQSRIALSAAGLATYGAALLATRGRPTPVLATIGSLGLATATASATSALLIAEQGAAERLDPVLPGGRTAAHAAIFGAAGLAAAGLMLGAARRSAGLPGPNVPVQGTVPIGEAFDAARHEALVAARRAVRTTSGGPGSLLPAAALDRHGFRFVSEVTPASQISAVMGEPAVADPIRIYGGLGHGATPTEIVDRTFDEMLRLRAFDRAHIRFYSPSGSGYVNPVPVQADELLTRGDVASVAMQYNNQPSIKSMGKIPVGSGMLEAILRKTRDHLASLPPGAHRPEVTVYGESLGAWVSQDVFAGRGVAGLRELGVERALWVGTPRQARFKPELLGRAGRTFDATGTVGEVTSGAELAALPAAARDRLRYSLVTHLNDPVAKYERLLFVSRPEWLSDPVASQGVPPREKWYPLVTALQTMLDAKRATNVQAGYFDVSGHDYRGELARAVATAFDLPASRSQLRAIRHELVQGELARARIPLVLPSPAPSVAP